MSQHDRQSFGIAFWSALSVLLVIVLVATLAPWLGLPEPEVVDWNQLTAPPSLQHWLGTDALGRDLLSRTIHGARVSLVVGFVAPLIGLLLGLVLGVIAGYYGGWLDELIGLLIETWMALPALVILLLLSLFFGGNLLVICGSLGLLIIPTAARIVRASTLTFAQREFVFAVRSMGASDFYIITREILPNVIWPLLAFAMLNIPLIIVAEGALSFLGLSVSEPTPSWGGLLAEGRNYLESSPRLALAPMVAMFVTVLALNIVGEGIRRRLTEVKEVAV